MRLSRLRSSVPAAADVPPSPDSTFADANHHRYASPGAHVGRAGRNGLPAKDARLDMGNAAKPLLEQVALLQMTAVSSPAAHVLSGITKQPA